jgi:hypothetical protein
VDHRRTIRRLCAVPVSGSRSILTRSDPDRRRTLKAPGSNASLSLDICSKRRVVERILPWIRIRCASNGTGKRKPEFPTRQATCVMGRTFIGAQLR